MLISCKCLNFIATSNKNQQAQQQQQQHQASSSPPQHQLQQQQKSLATGNATSADAPASPFKLQKPPHNTAVGNEWCNRTTTTTNTTTTTTSSNNNTVLNSGCSNLLSEELMQAFLQKYPRNFVFYSQCMDFFKQAIGPISDLTINAVYQRDLIYSLTLEVQQQSWQISFCINCNSALCAKRLQPAPSSPNGSGTPNTLPLYFINGALQTTNDELSHRRAERSFSETFGILIMDHPESEMMQHSGNVTPTVPNGSSAASSLNIGSFNTLASMASDPKQQRLRQLQQHLQQRLQREIAETDERIQRYTEQQFALLRSYREKSEQEFELLARLIQRVPEQVGGMSSLDRVPPALDVCEGVSYVARRRNTITGRRDLNGLNGANGVANTNNGAAPTTPTSPFAPINFNITSTQQQQQQQQQQQLKTANNSAIDATTTTIKNFITTTTNNTNTNTNNNTQQNNNNNGATTVTVIKANNNNRRMSNFDTPPATPEATPMSVGSSPTFQQETNLNGHIKSSQQLKQPQVKRIDDIQSDKKQQQQQMSLPIQSTYVRQQQQQQQQQIQQQIQQQHHVFANNANDTLDADCLFEWDGDDMESSVTDYYSPNATLQSTMYQQHSQLYQRSMSIASNHQDNTMSDLDDSDGAEEAEDAIDLDSSQPIPMQSDGRGGSLISDRLNFGKSLPIDIANSPMMEQRNNYINGAGVHEEDLECTLDIAASIKALAKSVHGEAVFGDLPRPRLRSQI